MTDCARTRDIVDASECPNLHFPSYLNRDEQVLASLKQQAHIIDFKYGLPIALTTLLLP